MSDDTKGLIRFVFYGNKKIRDDWASQLRDGKTPRDIARELAGLWTDPRLGNHTLREKGRELLEHVDECAALIKSLVEYAWISN